MPSESDLATFLADRDVLCPSCKYNLRGLKESRCPECNQELVLGVQLAVPFTRMYIAAISGPIAVGGSALLSLGAVGWASLGPGRLHKTVWLAFAVVPGIALVISICSVYALSRRAGLTWFGRLLPFEKWSIVIAGWAYALVVVVVFFLCI
ncbi:MAG TPA: hypothetical protein VK176_13620 [Phycisphaerales bacterium]|nr:hypothetical protein [Phycisphaerales bacterium]